MSARIPGLAKPYVWIQPKGTNEILKRLLEAREAEAEAAKATAIDIEAEVQRKVRTIKGAK